MDQMTKQSIESIKKHLNALSDEILDYYGENHDSPVDSGKTLWQLYVELPANKGKQIHKCPLDEEAVDIWCTLHEKRKLRRKMETQQETKDL